MPCNIGKNKRFKPTIGITLGDPGGIGPEITAKALSDHAVAGLANFVLIGDRAVYDYYCNHTMDSISFHDHQQIVEFDSPEKISVSTRGRAAYAYLETAVSLIKAKTIDGIVTAPVNKQAIVSAGIADFCGHTEMLAKAFGVKRVEMMFVGGPYKTLIATRHIPLCDVPSALTAETLCETIVMAQESLVRTFCISNPRVALCGINPHAGEKGKIGNEEIETIIPALEKARRAGIDVSGPFAADTLFIPRNAQCYDLIIAMYHDQGLAPIKALYFTKLVNFTIGLPFIRTSTAHGTAEDIAGENKADPSSMLEAIKLACELSVKQNA